MLAYGGGDTDTYTGTGLTYDSTGHVAGGTITGYMAVRGGASAGDFVNFSVPVATFVQLAANNDSQAAFQLLFSGSDTLIGGPNADILRAFAGDDYVSGGGGNDILDGGVGTDTLILSGKFADYAIKHQADGTYLVQDTRSGSPDGTDTVSNFEIIQFADGTQPFSSSVGYAIRSEHLNVLRTDPLAGYNGTAFAAEVQAAEFNGLTTAQAASQVALLADGTTSVASLAYQFFTGSTPTPEGLDYLVSPTGSNPNNLNSPYYAQFSTENRYINFAVNLGKVGAGVAAFQADYGSLSLSDATTKAYAAIFGFTPTADKVSHLLNDLVPNGAGGTYVRENYFAAYGQDGVNGIGTKAAMVGWLISQADSGHIGTLETANMSYLSDLATGTITGRVDLIGTYHGTPYTGG